MRDHSKVSPRFWIGATGKSLRGDKDALIVAFYLMTCPTSNMIGLFYLPIPVLCHETGLSQEGASKGLRRLSEGGFAYYDVVSEYVYLPEMARIQIGEELKPKDNQVKSVLRQLNEASKCRFVHDFWEKYKIAFHLPETSPFEGPSDPLRSQEQEQEQDIDILSLQNGGTPPAPSNHIPYKEIIDYLNQKTGKRFSCVGKETQKFIRARWSVGFRLEDFQRVIDIKTAKWATDPKMVDYLRPETLFGTKFESYLNENGFVSDNPDYDPELGEIR